MLYGQLDEFRSLAGTDDLLVDDAVHRYGDKKTKWYALHDMDFAFVGVYGDWRSGEVNKWVSSKTGQTLTVSENAALNAKIKESRAKALEEKKRMYDEVAESAKKLWEQCKKDGFVHKYLEDKKVKALGVGWYRGDLIIPLKNHNGELRSYQKITSAGDKFFPEGGQVKGLFHRINSVPGGLQKIFICEGYATGATIHEATGAAVIVALNAGNIPAVAEYFPGAIVACDNDQWKPEIGNPGIEAGKKTGLPLVCPRFAQTEGKPTDFNDLALSEGLQAVREQLMSAAERDRISLGTLASLLEFKIEERPVIRGLLDEKESMLIIGRGGLGKSLLTTEIAIKLGMDMCGCGKNLLFGKFEIPKIRKSIFIQSENTIQGTLKRLVKILDYEPDYGPAMENVFIPIIHSDMRLCGSFMDDSFRERVIQLIKQSGAEAMFIDPLISYHDQNENDNVAMRNTLDRITGIQDETGITAIIVHHAGKAGTSNDIFAGRGASAIGDWAANILVMHDATPEEEKTETEKPVVIRLEHAKQRNHEPRPDIYLRRTEGLTFKVVDNPNKAKAKDDMDLIMDILNEFGGEIESQTKLIDVLNLRTGMTKKQARNRVEAALKSGVIFCDFRGGNNSKIIRVSVCPDS